MQTSLKALSALALGAVLTVGCSDQGAKAPQANPAQAPVTAQQPAQAQPSTKPGDQNAAMAEKAKAEAAAAQAAAEKMKADALAAQKAAQAAQAKQPEKPLPFQSQPGLVLAALRGRNKVEPAFTLACKEDIWVVL
jgi:hypothetical protein